jgi:hypothetical protein
MTQLEWQNLEKTIAGMTQQEKQRLLAMVTKSLAELSATVGPSRPTADQFEAELVQVTFDAPPLAVDFSRADVYSDHD